ncbi:hypothetical protein D3C73_1465140 [compost metagenome]
MTTPILIIRIQVLPNCVMFFNHSTYQEHIFQGHTYPYPNFPCHATPVFQLYQYFETKFRRDARLFYKRAIFSLLQPKLRNEITGCITIRIPYLSSVKFVP